MRDHLPYQYGPDRWRMKGRALGFGVIARAEIRCGPDALERDAEERRRRSVTFRQLAAEYLRWLEDIKGAKPSTLRDHRLLLAEPGTAYRRGAGASRGVVMAALGDRSAREVTTREIEDLVRSVAATGVAPRTVNKVRRLVRAVFNYGMRPSTYALPVNPATHADRRAEPERAVLAFYSPEQIESLARSLAAGAHRDPSRPALEDDEMEARRSTKSRRVREVPLPDQAAVALERLSRRDEFTGPDDYAFCGRLGRRLDPSALRRRYERARNAAGLEPLRFHDLRRTYGSLLGRRRDRPRERQGRHGPLSHHDDRALPPRPARQRASQALHPCSRGSDGPGDRRVSTPELPRRITDPDGREIEFSERSWQHIRSRRPQLLDDLHQILEAIERPDHR
ncbi:MAG: tyrosine-type recombinase/integrase [Trebonia sp.]